MTSTSDDTDEVEPAWDVPWFDLDDDEERMKRIKARLNGRRIRREQRPASYLL